MNHCWTGVWLFESADVIHSVQKGMRHGTRLKTGTSGAWNVCVSACMCILINTCNNFYSHKSHYCLWKVKTQYLYINRKPLMYRLRLWCLILCLFNHSLTVTTFRDTWGNFWNYYQNCNSMTKQLSCPLVTCTFLRQLTVLAQRGHLQPSSAPLRLNWE